MTSKEKYTGDDDAIASKRGASTPKEVRRKPPVANSCEKTTSSQDALHQDEDSSDDAGFITVTRKRRPRATKEIQKPVNVSWNISTLILFVF